MTNFISPSRFYPIAPSADLFETYVEAGARFIQIRIKDAPNETVLLSEITRCARAAEKANVICVVNDYWKIAIAVKAPFVHLGQEDLQTADLQKLRDHKILFGVSTHNQEELENALRVEPDYIALGPIFHTRLKAMKFDPQGVEKIAVWKKRIANIPLIAIGGLTIERAKECISAGADAVSVVTDLSLSNNPTARIKEWIAEIEKSDR